MHVWDVEGSKYLDFFGGILTVSVGHCNDKVAAAIGEQAKMPRPHVDALPERAHRLARRADRRPDARGRRRQGPPAEGVLHQLGHRGRRDGRAHRAPVHGPHRGHRAAPRLLGPLGARHDAHRAGPVAPLGRGRAGREAHGERVLLPLPVRAHVPVVRGEVRAGHGGDDPHHDQRPASRRSSPSRSRAWAGSSRRPRSSSRSSSRPCAATAASSSATRCRRASAARARTGTASSTGASSPRS